MKAIIIIIVILVLIGIIGFYLLGNSKLSEEAVDINNEQSNKQKQNEQNVVEIRSSGFNPKVLTINSGESVRWVNNYNLPSWPASNVHPIHSAYPERGGCIGSTFDACRNLKQGESFSFTFNEKGTWKYHDHLDPGTGGTIIVK